MSFSKFAAAAALTFVCTGAVFAQETEADPSDGLDLGTPVQAEPEGPQPGQTYTAAVFNDWSLRCLKQEEGTDPCQLYQLLAATIVAPLETLLTEQLTISVDGSQPRRYAFTFCNAGGCVARVGFTTEEVTQFKRGNAATLRLVPAGNPESEVILNVSLSGFTAAMNALGS